MNQNNARILLGTPRNCKAIPPSAQTVVETVGKGYLARSLSLFPKQ
jgi:hypothetical protein